ncbi:hypothetical protein J6590_102048 [Homalodisca vitripennis]|nr:hypothetical protein J6590_102048 [Homalodisca vitripennis]
MDGRITRNFIRTVTFSKDDFARGQQYKEPLSTTLCGVIGYLGWVTLRVEAASCQNPKRRGNRHYSRGHEKGYLAATNIMDRPV